MFEDRFFQMIFANYVEWNRWDWTVYPSEIGLCTFGGANVMQILSRYMVHLVKGEAWG